MLHAADDARAYRRAVAVLALDRGQALTQVAAGLEVSRQSVYNWWRDATRDAPTSPAPGPRGRPRVWTPALMAALSAALQQSPTALGFSATEWTVPLLVAHLARWTPAPLSDDTVRRELRRRGLVWKRPRYVLTPDPDLDIRSARSAVGLRAARAARSSSSKTRPTSASSRR